MQKTRKSRIEHTYISLGSACDTAMIMDLTGVRKKGFPFDWLWNLDTGLDSVTEIIVSDFKQIIANDCYVESRHYRFPDPMVVYKRYPSIVHMHSNPLKDIAAHEQIRRRSFRFIEEMEKNSFKHFIYYRCFEEDQLRGKSDSVDDTFRRLIGEGEAFLKMILDKYPDCRNEIHMLLVLQVDRHWLLQAKELVAAFKAERIDNKYRNIINAGYTLRRNDGDKKLLWVWHIQWIYLFLFQTHMPFSYRLAVLYKLLRRR